MESGDWKPAYLEIGSLITRLNASGYFFPDAVLAFVEASWGLFEDSKKNELGYFEFARHGLEAVELSLQRAEGDAEFHETRKKYRAMRDRLRDYELTMRGK